MNQVRAQGCFIHSSTWQLEKTKTGSFFLSEQEPDVPTLKQLRWVFPGACVGECVSVSDVCGEKGLEG